MPEEEYEVEATIEDVIYENVRREYAARMDTLLTVAFSLIGAGCEEVRKETIRLYGAFRFERGQDVGLRYVLGEERLPGSLWKKTPYCEIKEMKCREFSILLGQRINLE